MSKPMGETEVRFIAEEILEEEILVRLPVKSIIRFKSVCKSWRSIFQSRAFIDSHHRFHRVDYSDQLLFSPYKLFTLTEALVPSTDSIKQIRSKPNLALPHQINSLRLTGQCRSLGPLNNSIYCLIAHAKETCSIALCNPATRDFRFTTPFPDKLNHLLSGSGKEFRRFSYGFCNSEGDYKVVVVIRSGDWFTSFVSFVYSLKCGNWREIVDDEVHDFESGRGGDLELCPQRLLRGCWHWGVMGRDHVYSVLSFDFASDTFQVLAKPPLLMHTMDGVLVLNDHLAVIEVRPDIGVWMMMEYGVEESWTKIYSVKTGYDGSFMRLVVISSLLPVDDGYYCIQRIFFEDHCSELISCDDSGFVKHRIYNIASSLCWNTVGVSTYMETLEPLNPHNVES